MNIAVLALAHLPAVITSLHPPLDKGHTAPQAPQNPNANLSNVTWNVSEWSGLTAELTEEDNRYDRWREKREEGEERGNDLKQSLFHGCFECEL